MQESSLKLYNTATRKLEKFKPLNEVVKIYTCGPTVYSTPHIGNYAAYIYWDLLVRTLKANNFRVKRVLNITDVGHLVSDGDEGEDKLEKGARKTGKTAFEVAEYYTEEFLKDFSRLSLVQPEVLAKATDYIEQDQKMVKTLTEKGFTYETTDGVYFDTTKFSKYAEFARLDLDNLRAGARVDMGKKHNVSDFAVWKFIQPGEKHEMRWKFLGKDGYPGWHLECSSIIHEQLGETIDIHTGGIDHIPVHHSNEIAQSEAAYDQKLSKYWLHCNFLTVNGEKISKSLGNTITIEDLIEKNYSPLDYKLWVLQGHYQTARDFTFDNLDAARTRRLNWRNQIALAYQNSRDKLSNEDEKKLKEVLAAVNENLNSALAFAVIDSTNNTSIEFWEKIDEMFGLNLIADSPKISDAQATLLRERAKARVEKDFDKSDELRAKIEQVGLAVLDTPDGQVWQYLN